MFWNPDSCTCRIDVGNDWTLSRFVEKCPAHSGLSDQQAWDAIWRPDNKGENQRGPSNTLDEIIQNAPAAMYDLQADGSRTFKQGINVSWNWTGTAPSRILNINVNGFTPTTNQRNAIMAKLDSRFGAGNVTVTFA